jgi:hypothetical protein
MFTSSICVWFERLKTASKIRNDAVRSLFPPLSLAEGPGKSCGRGSGGTPGRVCLPGCLGQAFAAEQAQLPEHLQLALQSQALPQVQRSTLVAQPQEAFSQLQRF